ncbi:MAG: glycosyltransferase [Acidimicrobiia bacterium]
MGGQRRRSRPRGQVLRDAAPDRAQRRRGRTLRRRHTAAGASGRDRSRGPLRRARRAAQGPRRPAGRVACGPRRTPGRAALGRGAGDRVGRRRRGARLRHRRRRDAAPPVPLRRRLLQPGSLRRGFGIVLLEAMAAGTAVVASDIPGYAAVSRAGECGRLVPVGDGGALAAELVDLIGDPVARTALTAAGRRRAAEFDWPGVAARMAGHYEAVLGRARPR